MAIQVLYAVGETEADSLLLLSCWWTQVQSQGTNADNAILTHCESQRPSKFVSDYPGCVAPIIIFIQSIQSSSGLVLDPPGTGDT